LRSKLSQLILIILDHSFQMESISFCERGLRGEISHSYMLSSKQGSIWYHFYNVFGMMQSGIEPTTIHSQGECPTTEPLVWYTCCLLRQLCRKIKLRTRYYLNHFKETLSLAVGFEPLNHTLQHLQTNLRVLCSLCRQTWAYFAAFADKLERTLQHLQTNLSVPCRTCRQTWARLLLPSSGHVPVPSSFYPSSPCSSVGTGSSDDREPSCLQQHISFRHLCSLPFVKVCNWNFLTQSLIF